MQDTIKRAFLDLTDGQDADAIMHNTGLPESRCVEIAGIARRAASDTFVTVTDILIRCLDNDEGFANKCRARANDAHTIDHAQVRNGIWTHAQAELFVTADAIRDLLTTWLDDLPLGTLPGNMAKHRKGIEMLVVSLVQSALDDVEWSQVAQHFLNKLGA